MIKLLMICFIFLVGLNVQIILTQTVPMQYFVSIFYCNNFNNKTNLVDHINWVLFNMLLKNIHKSLNQRRQQRYMLRHSHWLGQPRLQVT